MQVQPERGVYVTTDMAKHSPGQKFYYFPDMLKQEAMLLKVGAPSCTTPPPHPWG